MRRNAKTSLGQKQSLWRCRRATLVEVAMSAFADEHNAELGPQKNSRHRRTQVLSYGTAKKMMSSGSGLNEEVKLRPNDLQEVPRKAASEGCESTQEEVRGHTNQFEEQSSAPCSSSLYSTRSWRSRQPDNEVQEPRGNTCRACGAS